MYNFSSQLARIVNTGQTRSVILTGNIDDMFFDGEKYVPLTTFLSNKYKLSRGKERGIVQVLYEVNKKIRLVGDKEGVESIRKAFVKMHPNDNLDKLLDQAFDTSNSVLALEVLRQLTVSSRTMKLDYDLMVIIERAELLTPQVEYARMGDFDRKRVSIVHDWFSEPEFCDAHDTVILIAESRNQIHSLVSKIPQVLNVDIPLPNLEEREHFLDCKNPEWRNKHPNLGLQTAGLSIHALRQLLCEGDISAKIVNYKVQEFITSQLGEGVVEFKRPTHTLDDVIGLKDVKDFIINEMIPRCTTTNPDEAMVGAAVAGPIGGGKTFCMEGFASMLGVPVLVLKNLRSQWYGQTDVTLERLYRVLVALGKVIIFMDEADTELGGLGANTHETERRLTGKIQAMMSDPTLRGKVFWLLMTARIEMLSPDLKREGRAGDLIIPILDPEGEDRVQFLRWVLSVIKYDENEKLPPDLIESTKEYSAAAYANLRSNIKSKRCKNIDEVMQIVYDLLPTNIGSTRRYQTLQALLSCTRRSLLPREYRDDVAQARKMWSQELQTL